jgi:hypothetical protein
VLALFATFPVLDRLLRDAGRPDPALLAPFVVAPTLAAFTASTVGVVLTRRRPRHPVGWLLPTVGLLMALGGVCAGYLPYTVVVRPGALPVAGLLARAYAPATAPPRPWPPSSRPAAASSGWSTAALTAATTPAGSSTPSGPRLRDQVDLDALNTGLLAVIDQTMQPTRASLWLRSTG